MILEVGSQTAVSFTDDTSLDSRRTNNEKVSIHAEVLREKPLDWYIKLISFYPDIRGELKSSSITDCFLSLSEADRNKLQSTLKFVRVHIVDPRPYLKKVKGAINELLPGRDVDEFLARLDNARNDVAQRFQDLLRRQAAERMVDDSPSEQLKFCIRTARMFGGYGFLSFFAHDNDNPFFQSRYGGRRYNNFDFGPFEDKQGRIRLANMSVYFSKSGPVFIDTLNDVSNNPSHYSGPWNLITLGEKLSVGRAFDKGDEKAISWIRNEREEVMEMADRFSNGRLPNLS